MDINKILILGGTGFFGGATADLLETNGYNVIRVGSFCDLRDEQQAQGLFQGTDFDIVINFASLAGGIAANLAEPGRFFYDNIKMGVNAIHEAYKSGKCKKFIQIGSVCSYGENSPIPFNENDLFKYRAEWTNRPYAEAKLSLLSMLEAYKRNYGFNFNYLLPTNIFGPKDAINDTTSHIIGALIYKFHKAITNNENIVTLFGDGSPRRELLYIYDAVRAVKLCLENCESDLPINIPGGNEYSINYLSGLISGLMNYNGDVIWDKTRPNGNLRRKLCGQRAKDLIGYEPQISLVDGLKTTIEWYREKITQ